MDALRHFVQAPRGPYNPYGKWPEDVERLFAFFDEIPEGTYSMRSLSEVTGVPLRTLYRWRKVHHEQFEWRPNTNYCEKNPRIFPDEIEHEMAEFLKDNFTVLHRGDQSMVQS
jgi:hypothetical protein